MRVITTFCLLIGFSVAAACDSTRPFPEPNGDTPPVVGPASVTRSTDFRDWGWETYVLSNDFVSLAAVPAIGGRVMSYTIDDIESMWVNAAQIGTTPEPVSGGWPNHGGFKNWPAPQSRWNWPPPPVLDYGRYEADVLVETPDSVTLRLLSSVERFRTPGLRFLRHLTLYAGSSRVRVEQTLMNEGDDDAEWSIWDVTQHIVNHPGERDFDNFRIYFPVNPESRYGGDGVRFDRSSAAWSGIVDEGVFEVQFRPDSAKLFADSRGGWICYVNLREGYAWAKSFPVFENAVYPDQGADVEVYVSDQLYVEVEVLSPIVSISANGGSSTFVENWWAARTEGPVLSVNNVGLVNARLRLDDASSRITGTFGVFHAGLAYAVIRDGDGKELARTSAQAVRPDQLLTLDEPLTLPPGAAVIELTVEDTRQIPVGVLDALRL